MHKGIFSLQELSSNPSSLILSMGENLPPDLVNQMHLLNMLLPSSQTTKPRIWKIHTEFPFDCWCSLMISSSVVQRCLHKVGFELVESECGRAAKEAKQGQKVQPPVCNHFKLLVTNLYLILPITQHGSDNHLYHFSDLLGFQIHPQSDLLAISQPRQNCLKDKSETNPNHASKECHSPSTRHSLARIASWIALEITIASNVVK